MSNNASLMGIKRKCDCCKNIFYISDSNINEAIFYENKSYHKECFIDMCKNKIATSRKYKEKWKSAFDSIELIEKNSIQHFTREIDKDKLYRFLCEQYHLSVFPTLMFKRLDEVYTGTYKGLTKEIPPEHLCDMWKRQMNNLNKIAFKNESKGNHISLEKRLYYDLSIVVNKYNSYLEWLEKQKILESEVEEKMKMNDKDHLIDDSILRFPKNVDNSKDNINDISSLVDDIFG